jgi:protease PrsW
MRYFYEDATQGRLGPYTLEELRQLHLNGTIRPDTTILSEDGLQSLPFQEFWAGTRRSSEDGPAAGLAGKWASVESFTLQARADLKALIPHLLLPWDEIKSFRWVQNRKFIAAAVIGLLPLLIIAHFGESGDIQSAYWAVALYFSGLWAVFFYYLFPSPRVTLLNSVLAFFGTGMIALTLLLVAYRFPPLSWIVNWTQSAAFPIRWLGYTAAVGLPEEACKALILFFLWRKADPLPPQTMLFYGLMSGLGFGIYEGVSYQMGRNVVASAGIGEYYLLNVLRLTTLPFLHAIWTGIAGYFLGFAFLYPQRQRGLIIVAIGLPALLHGTYDAVGTYIKVLLATFSLLALMLYLAKSVDFERMIAERKSAE